MAKPIFLLLLLVLLLPAAALADGEKEYRAAMESYRKLNESSRDRQFRDHWDRLIGRFLLVQKKNPQHRRAAAALYQAGNAARDLYAISRRPQDATRAVELFQSVADKYPDSSLADDSLLFAAQLYEGPLVDRQQAYLHYQSIVDRFPHGDMAPA
ncbi:MAG: tetratricopeptide repeat protein, partial [Desulfuromonadales bacterium]|nr:tetratricopeptide repeat protein [Desulfuromonadales bacterium]